MFREETDDERLDREKAALSRFIIANADLTAPERLLVGANHARTLAFFETTRHTISEVLNWALADEVEKPANGI